MLPISARIVVPIIIVVLVIVILAALLILRPGGLGGGATSPSGGATTGTGTETTQTETATGTETGGTVRAGLRIEHVPAPNVTISNVTGVVIVEIRNIKVTGYGTLCGNVTVTIRAGGIAKSYRLNYSQTTIKVSGTRFITLLSIRIEDVEFARKVLYEFKGLDITLYYEDPETGSCISIGDAWMASELGFEEETITPTRTAPGGGGRERW